MRLLVVSFFIMIVSSCDTRIHNPLPPKRVIPENEMVELIAEISVLEVAIENKFGQLSTSKNIVVATVDSLLAAKKITLERFKSSLNYYHSVSDGEQNIYSEVITSLNLQKEQVK